MIIFAICLECQKYFCNENVIRIKKAKKMVS